MKGAAGRSGALWSPLEIARILAIDGAKIENSNYRGSGGERYQKKTVSLAILNAVFKNKLPAWEQAWQKKRSELED